MSRPLEFQNVAEAVSILGNYKTEARLRAMEAAGFDLSEYTHKELGAFVHASREKVTIAMGRMGKRRHVREEKANEEG